MGKMFGKRLRKFREERKLSLQELADLCKVAKIQIARFEWGMRTPNLESLVKLAKSLKLSLDELVGFKSP